MSNNITVNVGLDERSYTITIRPGLLDQTLELLKEKIDKRRCLVIADSHVYSLYGERMEQKLREAGAEVSSSVFPEGEENKHLNTMAAIYHDAVKAGLNRKSLIVALGGGVSGDIAGFAAATYMRGIEFIQIPTSLLAMVDSSVGGKTGVDLPEGKNLVGAFWQPKAVIIDPKLLTTLDIREIRCGLAEIVKYAVIIDAELFDLLQNNVDKLLNLDLDFYAQIIARCCKIKAKIVAEDEREAGVRALLNYGHTFGHAIEQVANFSIGHGEGVAIGMCMAADLAVKLGLCAPGVEQKQRILLESLGLPCSTELAPEAIREAMKSDKKNTDGTTVVVLPRGIGRAEVVDDAPSAMILDAIKQYSTFSS
ncbi:MAG: 3-dehydroquinate synthase [Victivallaceae bacterium]|nr:3-dehydroquinate synthase [Victivallaceae bacterium]